MLLSAHYFPCVQWYHYFLNENTEIERFENYQKGSYRNRCHIIGGNGIQRLSIPLASGKNQQLPITEVRMDLSENWRKEHWRSIMSAYGKSPFFEFYADEIKAIFDFDSDNLFDFNIHIIRELNSILGISKKLEFTEEYQKINTGLDFRKCISPKEKNQLDTSFETKKYAQVFQERHGFSPNLSVLDVLFCTGPETMSVMRGK